ncbi:MAG: PEP-CTERM sorting domain-containing protein [Gammaproteobacteria bacterium]|nr:PEP-CTERM sorting domain-containing protein [Gammaproteobacteria bacterium]
MRKLLLGWLFSALTVSPAALAVTIFYDLEQDTDGTWRYIYTVINDSGTEFDGFTIYFDPDETAGVDIADTPQDWDGLVLLLDPELPAAAAVDWLNFGAPLVLGDSVGGFVASFTWLGDVLPSDRFFDMQQFFELYTLSFGPGCDAFLGCFDIVYEGVTVPEPGTLALLSALLLALALQRRRSQSTPRRTALS